MSRLKVVVVNGSPTRPSRTRALAESIVAEIEREVAVDTAFVDLAEVGTALGASLFRKGLPQHLEDALLSIETADLLVVASPVYKGSYPGLFKHVFDLVAPEALTGKPVLLAATGGGDKHALVIEHQLRPLFGFFRAQTLPTGIYGAEADLKDYVISSDTLASRVTDAALEAVRALRQLGAERAPAAPSPTRVRDSVAA